MSYGVSGKDLFCRAASYGEKTAKGAHPGDLPVEQPTNFEFIIKLRTGISLTDS